MKADRVQPIRGTSAAHSQLPPSSPHDPHRVLSCSNNSFPDAVMRQNPGIPSRRKQPRNRCMSGAPRRVDSDGGFAKHRSEVGSVSRSRKRGIPNKQTPSAAPQRPKEPGRSSLFWRIPRQPLARRGMMSSLARVKVENMESAGPAGSTTDEIRQRDPRWGYRSRKPPPSDSGSTAWHELGLRNANGGRRCDRTSRQALLGAG